MWPAFKRNPAEGEFLAKREIEIGEGLICGGYKKCTKDVMQHMFGTHPCLPAMAIRRIYEGMELEFMVQTCEADDNPDVESARGWTRPSARCVRALGLDPKMFVDHLPKSWTPSQPLMYKNYDGAIVGHGYLYDLIAKVDLGNNIPKNVQHPNGRKVDHHVSNYTEARYKTLMPDNMTNNDLWLIIQKEHRMRDMYRRNPKLLKRGITATPNEIKAYKAKRNSDSDGFAGHFLAKRDPDKALAHREEVKARVAAAKVARAAAKNKATTASEGKEDDGNNYDEGKNGGNDGDDPTPVTPQAKKQKANA